jgi:hypothetical protein
VADSQLDYAQRLAEKRVATDEELAMYRQISYGRFEISVGDRLFRLDSEDEQDNLDPEERNAAVARNPYWDDDANAPEAADCPDNEDHRTTQTRIKDQGDRGTCVCFASLANLEAILKAQSEQDIDLSEQYANWLYMTQEGRNQCNDGLRTTLAARYLSTHGVCEESDYPYEDLVEVLTHCTTAPLATAQNNAKYGIGQHVLIDRLGLLGPSIANPAYLEALICRGYDIVFGTHVAWGRPDANGVYDVILDGYGNPVQSRGGHAMLIVGYDRSSPLSYFICKNSWGTETGDSGYYYLSYDYVRTYAKYGYIVEQIRTDMPAPPI